MTHKSVKVNDRSALKRVCDYPYQYISIYMFSNKDRLKMK